MKKKRYQAFVHLWFRSTTFLMRNIYNFQNCKLQILKGCYLQARSNVSCHGTEAFQAPKLVTVQLLLSKQQSLRVGGWEKYWKSCWMQKPMSKIMRNRSRKAVASIGFNFPLALLIAPLPVLLSSPYCTTLLSPSLIFQPGHAVLFSTLIFMPSFILAPPARP